MAHHRPKSGSLRPSRMTSRHTPRYMTPRCSPRAIALAVACVLALLVVDIAPAAAQYRSSRRSAGIELDPDRYPTLENLLDGAPEAGEDQAVILWRRYWKRFADRYTLFEDKPRQLLKWEADSRYPSSRRVTPSDVARETRRTITETMGPGWTRTHEVDTLTKDSAETLAKVLPAVAPGEFGWVHSVNVEEILGPEEMLVRDIWVVDAPAIERTLAARESRMRDLGYRGKDPFAQVLDTVIERQNEDDFQEQARLVGFKTLSVEPGRRWTGPSREGLDVAVVATEIVSRDTTYFVNAMTRGADRDRRMVLMPREQVKTLDEEGFTKALESWGLTRETFVRLLLKLMQEDPKLAEEAMLQSLELLQAGHEVRLAVEAAAKAEAEAAAGNDTAEGGGRSRSSGGGMSALERWRAAQQAKREGGSDDAKADDDAEADSDDDGEKKMSALERYRRLRGESADDDADKEDADSKDAEAE